MSIVTEPSKRIVPSSGRPHYEHIWHMARRVNIRQPIIVRRESTKYYPVSLL